MGQARRQRRGRGGAVRPMHEVQQRAILATAGSGGELGGQRMARRQPGQRERKAAPARIAETGIEQAPNNRTSLP